MREHREALNHNNQIGEYSMSAEIQPGIYPNMSNEFYHSIAGLSSTGIRLLDDNPARYDYRYNKGHHPDQTQAMVIGQAFHTKTLEPESFYDRFAITPQFNNRTNEGKAQRAAFAEANAGKTVITEADNALVANLASAVHDHPAAGYLLSLPAKVEESIFWEEQVAGVPVLCKCRPDWRVTSDGVVVDLKKTAKGAGPADFSRTIYTTGYHFQAALYLRGVSVATGRDYDDFIFIAVEEEPPHLVAVYSLTQEVMSRTWSRIEQLLEIYVRCTIKKQWPGYSAEVTPIALPAWAR
jgi:exodeoxyribonuclease VIII